MKFRLMTLPLVLATILALWFGVVASPLMAQNASDSTLADTGAEPRTESQQQAWDHLMRMTHYLAGLDRFSVTAIMGFDVLQDSGLKLEFVESRDIQLDRPGLLRIEEESAAGRGQTVVFDGSSMTIYDGDAGVFAQAPQPETVDDAILYFVRELGMRLPLAPLLTTWAPVEIERRVQWIDYVEETSVFGRPAHHLAARTADIDFQVWVADGEQALPLRIVITYPEAGQPQFWAQFSQWNVAPQFAEGTFTFTPPEGSQHIPFAVQIPEIEPAPISEPEEGEQP